jgi:hypothetical protein
VLTDTYSLIANNQRSLDHIQAQIRSLLGWNTDIGVLGVSQLYLL